MTDEDSTVPMILFALLVLGVRHIEWSSTAWRCPAMLQTNNPLQCDEVFAMRIYMLREMAKTGVAPYASYCKLVLLKGKELPGRQTKHDTVLGNMIEKNLKHGCLIPAESYPHILTLKPSCRVHNCACVLAFFGVQ